MEIKKYKSSKLAVELSNEDSTFYVGETDDIKRMYEIALNNGDATPLFSETPKFSDNKQIYCLEIDKDNYMVVINSDTFLMMLLEGYVEEIK